ncbi:MAG TPA: ATP-binding protein, partial [Aggregatilineaceae bacterium]|nr:ATP-binding protein [Aggregatilineaceae bacterium]
GYSQILRRDKELPAKHRHSIETIEKSGDHLLSMINDILDLSKIEAGRMELDLEAIRVAEVAEEVAQITSILLKDKPVELVIDLAPDLPEVWADKVRLRQVLNNLVSNAAKFTNQGEIRIVAQLTERSGTDNNKMVLVRVTDTGEGIAPEHLELVFQQFRQVDSSSTRRAGGTGMGLTITRHLVHMQGGEIGVESTVGEGSIFYFTVPVAPVAVA